MTIVAHAHPFVIGVDTHARNHALAVLAATGEVIDTAQFPTSSGGMARAISWAARRTGGDQSALWVIEDDIRDCERAKDFGETFIRLARAVYVTNDRRAEVKKKINLLLGSALIEEKSYKDHGVET